MLGRYDTAQTFDEAMEVLHNEVTRREDFYSDEWIEIEQALMFALWQAANGDEEAIQLLQKHNDGLVHIIADLSSWLMVEWLEHFQIHLAA